MAQITIVGLGPGDAGDLTRDAWQVLRGAGEVWLRTLHHPVVADLPAGLTVHAFDEVYESADCFSEVYGEIVGHCHAVRPYFHLDPQGLFST